MFTRPEELSDETVARVVGDEWRVAVASVEYAAVGFGSHHWRVLDRNGDRWFLTVDDLVAKRHDGDEPLERGHERLRAALRTARRLRDAGLGFVVAPTPTWAEDVLAPIDDRFVAALYPWIEGRSHDYGVYDNDVDRDEVLRLLSSLHAVDPATVPEAGREDFALQNRTELVGVLDDPERGWSTGPYGDRARSLVSERVDDVAWLIDRYDSLAAAAAERPERAVVTHGEPHAANTIVTASGRMLIDWDTALIAPPERDLWMVLDRTNPTTLPSYAPSPAIEVERELLDLYRMLWDLTEIAGYVAYFRAPHDDTADAAASWHNLLDYIDISARWGRPGRRRQ